MVRIEPLFTPQECEGIVATIDSIRDVWHSYTDPRDNKRKYLDVYTLLPFACEPIRRMYEQASALQPLEPTWNAVCQRLGELFSKPVKILPNLVHPTFIVFAKKFQCNRSLPHRDGLDFLIEECIKRDTVKSVTIPVKLSGKGDDGLGYWTEDLNEQDGFVLWRSFVEASYNCNFDEHSKLQDYFETLPEYRYQPYEVGNLYMQEFPLGLFHQVHASPGHDRYTLQAWVAESKFDDSMILFQKHG